MFNEYDNRTNEAKPKKFRVNSDSTNRNRRFEAGIVIREVEVIKNKAFVYPGVELLFADGKKSKFAYFELTEVNY